MGTLPAFYLNFSPLPLPEEMRAWDAGAVALGLPESLLMENAARAALDVLQEYWPNLTGRPVWLFMGGGNNGGDAACLARHLLDAGACPLVWHIRPLSGFTGAAARHIRVARAAGAKFSFVRSAERLPWEHAPEILVDGLLGTGFQGPLRPQLQALIECINALPARFVLALDIPSGLDGADGRTKPVAVRAQATVSFAAAKPGLVYPWARPHTGRVHLRPIGIPALVQCTAPCAAYLLDRRCLDVLPAPLAQSHKNSFGHVLVLGGGPGLCGAAHLAARAALRAGAGLVTAAAPAQNVADIRCSWPEIMTLALGESTASLWPQTLPQALHALLKRCAALAVGPGMGRGQDAEAFLAALLALPQRPPAVLDADALMLLARRRDLLSALRPTDILSPHPGEAAALLQSSAALVQADRLAALRGLCALSPAAVILKGAGCLVGQAGAPFFISPYDVPQLAVGGSGDVLSGCLAAVLATVQAAGPQEDAALRAACLGVAWHALAGQACAVRCPARGNTASELAELLPQVLGPLTDQIQEAVLCTKFRS